jgi:hypothetical protein
MSTQNTKNDNNTMEHEYPKLIRIYELCKNCGERKEAHREFNDGNSVYSFYVCDNFELLLDT